MRGPRLNILLFVLTIFSTLFAGAYFIAEYDLLADFPKYFLTGLIKGIPFSLPLLLILGAHEFAHYYTSRRHNVDATLPYFIPFPNL
ncbi:MAG TPA: site-2 protease family protein, partial [Nitrospirota bacterium]